MPSPSQVMCKRVETFNSSFMKAQGGDDVISQGKGGSEKKVTLSGKDTEKGKAVGSDEKPDNAMTYEDLLMRNKQLERSAQILVVLSKHMRVFELFCFSLHPTGLQITIDHYIIMHCRTSVPRWDPKYLKKLLRLKK